MTFVDGWVCQSCWKSNRPRDARCYRCRTPRGADQAEIEAARVRREAEVRRASRVPDLVVALPAEVFKWYGRLLLLSAILFLLGTPVVLSNPDAPSEILPVWIGFVAIAFVLAFAVRWASNAMRSSNPWAFVVGLVVSLFVIGVNVLAMRILPAGGDQPLWFRYVIITIFGFSAILALVGLLFSLRADPEAES